MMTALAYLHLETHQSHDMSSLALAEIALWFIALQLSTADPRHIPKARLRETIFNFCSYFLYNGVIGR